MFFIYFLNKKGPSVFFARSNASRVIVASLAPSTMRPLTPSDALKGRGRRRVEPHCQRTAAANQIRRL